MAGRKSKKKRGDESDGEKKGGRIPLFLAIGVGWVLLVILLIGMFSGGGDDAVDVKTRLDQNGALGAEGEEEEDGELAGGAGATGDDDGGLEPGTGSSSTGEASVTEGRAAGGSGGTTTTARSGSSTGSGSATTAAPLPGGTSGGGTSGTTGGGTSGTTAPPVTTTTTAPGATTTSSPSTSSTLPPTTTTTEPGTPPPTTASIAIVNSTFQPSEVTIAAGGTVTMSNDDNRVHSWKFSAQDDTQIGSNDPPVTRSFPEAGVYSFTCKFHSQMTGKVTVV